MCFMSLLAIKPPARALQPQRAGRSRVARGRHTVFARMHVPGDVFPGAMSPEHKAATMISLLCTAVAIRVVLAQLGGGGEGGDLPPTPDFLFLRDFLAATPLSGSGDEWLAELTAQNQLLGVRVMEVREAYCREDLDWERCRQLALQQITESNVALLRRHAADKFGSALQAAAEGGGPGAASGEEHGPAEDG